MNLIKCNCGVKVIGVIIIFALCAAGCGDRKKSTAGQKKDIAGNRSDSVAAVVDPGHFNEIEMDTTKWVEFESDYDFETFRTEVFTGELAGPDFTGNEFAKDPEYVDFITEGCNENGVNFGGRYTIIHRSCGCMCEHIFVVDRVSGKIHQDINLTTPDDGDGKWGYMYKPGSKMLIANSELFTTDKLDCYAGVYGTTPEIYLWTGANFKRIQ